MSNATKRILSLSLSGGGHLLPYHLAASATLLKHATSNNKDFPPIKSVSGSSAGAIAAVVVTRAPHRIHDYAQRFMNDGGRAFHHLEELLKESETETRGSSNVDHGRRPSLHICTTKCSDGSVHLFNFDNMNDLPSSSYQSNNNQSSLSETERILQCARASCAIPPSFHPWDVLSPLSKYHNQVPSYHDSEGIKLEDGCHHVDGGISAPAPPTPHHDRDEDDACRIVISPISGSGRNRISPKNDDDAWTFLPEFKCRGGFHVRPSIQNLRALRVAMGATSKQELMGWYRRGEEDAERFVRDFDIDDCSSGRPPGYMTL
mmetsp:Transcript_25273/g.37221  ORF Transcript_25273/g.37221 Transcript_25273/m.37221 type:complete len:318 (+) Transcript_25273:56-1009(+)|eukprot:CAMPEP_0195526352 /NCGR_PEP_ID=MMETSP0794_2-20130614/27354_1 /TAXON_ID=515487 /ORGANISM="Stephanopyxis turris, Strain CCMP 815" /LENGTH=317 /DNA_ID=CAMNT_0040657009 /DNA_START=55 /DNA_END=1008 /DNA_ORIENTATION=+